MLDFWFEFASPYSYVAAMRIGRLCREAGVTMRWRPFLLGPIFALQGWNTSHFNLNPRRGKYMWRDLERLTRKFAMPWTAQHTFPKNCVLAARVAAANAGADWIEAFVTAAFIANFGEDRDLNDEAVVLAVLSTIVDDSHAVLESSRAGGGRSTLRDNTQHAIKIGLFGAPNCIVGDELFWGEEALEDAVAWALKGVDHPNHVVAAQAASQRPPEQDLAVVE